MDSNNIANRERLPRQPILNICVVLVILDEDGRNFRCGEIRMKKNFSHTDRSYMFSAAKLHCFSIVLCINITNLLIVVVSSFGF